MMRVELRVYEGTKYEDVSEPKRIEYLIEGFEIVTGKEAEEIEACTDGSCIDECHEYLVLDFGNGETGTYRNSHVEMFRIA